MKHTSSANPRRRKASLIAGACACALSTIAGVGLTGVASAAPATVTLHFLNAYNSVTETPVMNKIVIPMFEKENPGIKVVDETVPYNGMLQKFIAEAAAGNPADLMRSDIAWMPELASQGVLLKLSGLKWFAPIKAAALPGPLSTNRYGASYYGVPDDTNTQVLFWNKADFKAAGLSGPPTTQNQLWNDAKILTVPSKGQFGLGVDSTDIWNVGPYVWSGGGQFTDPGYHQASGYMDSVATEAVLNQLVTMDQEGYIGSDFKGGAGAVGGETGFSKGEYAMLYDGPWGVNTYKTSTPPFSDYGLAPLPAGPGGSISVVGGEDLAIAGNGHHLADTIKFVQFLTSPFAQLAMAKAGDMAAYKPDAAQEVKNSPWLEIFTQQLLTAKARPVAAGYPAMDGAFSNALSEVLAGKASLSSAMQTAAIQGNAALATKS